MAVTGGDIVEITFANDSVGNGRFYGVAGEDSTFMAGGFANEDNSAVDGAGRLILSKNRKPGSFEVTVSNDTSSTVPEFDFVRRLKNSLDETTWTVQLSSDAIWAGVGSIVGEPSLSGNKATFQFKVVSGLGFVLQ